jgi:hypothetical protein
MKIAGNDYDDYEYYERITPMWMGALAIPIIFLIRIGLIFEGKTSPLLAEEFLMIIFLTPAAFLAIVNACGAIYELGMFIASYI